jgi:hypothetical protein
LKACEEYCQRQGFHVLARFREEGESAKTADRTELQKPLQFCRTKAKLEELFVEELARLQPTAGFMRLVKDRVLYAWREMRTDAAKRIAEIERKQKAIRSFRTESVSTGRGLLEPAQPCRFSTT